MSEKHMKPKSLDEIRRVKGKTDWNRLRREGDFEGVDDSDFAVDWASAELSLPEPKKLISMRVDQDLLEFFKRQGKGYQTRMNAVLRAYKEAQEKAR